MKNYLSVIVFLVFVIGCGQTKNNSLQGLEKLAWNSDVTEIKNYMENEINAAYKNYRMNRDEKTLSLFFKGGKYAGEDVGEWELKSKEGKFVSFKIHFPVKENVYERVFKTLENKLGKPAFSDENKTYWNPRSEKPKGEEKITLRKFSDAILLQAEISE